MLASQKPLRASPKGQHDENANGDVIGNEHGIPTAQIAPNHLSMGIFPHHSLYPHALLGSRRLVKIAHLDCRSTAKRTIVKF